VSKIRVIRINYMKKREITTNSEVETRLFAKNFAKTLKGGEVILLTGELGAGKTVFVQAVCDGLGIKQKVTSPTFILMNLYRVSKHKTIKRICHLDVYRLDDPKEFIDSGLDEYLYQKDTVCFIEWGEKIEKMLKKYIHATITIKGEKRKIIIK